MARKKKQETAEKTYKKAKWQGFVNVYLSDEEKKEIKENLIPLGALIEFVEGCLSWGYKFSCSYSEAGEFYSATLTGMYEGWPNGGVAMTLRHSDLQVAISALGWCLEQAGLENDWSERYTSGSTNDW